MSYDELLLAFELHCPQKVARGSGPTLWFPPDMYMGSAHGNGVVQGVPTSR